jgi:hypothetical protein
MCSSAVQGWARRLLIVTLIATAIRSGIAAPPPPAKYDVHIRYRIDAAPLDRVNLYAGMMRYSQRLGFVVDPDMDDDPSDANETRLRGTIPSLTARELLREPHVQAILLLPAGFKLPDDTAPVKVQLKLASGLPLDKQRLFADQTRTQLSLLGFQEAVGYDHRGHTRIVGTIPASKLEILLKDLREEPSGWLTPLKPAASFPVPLRDRSPVRVIEVIPEPADVAPVPAQAPASEPIDENDPLAKVSVDLRRLMTAEGADKPERMELILAYTPGEDDHDWQRSLTRAASVAIEGRLGPIITIQGFPRQATALAALPSVSVVRLLRPAVPSLRSGVEAKGDDREALRVSGVERLHAAGLRGRGVRVAIVDGDFRGYERFQGKQLPAGIRYVDLTAERNWSLEPDPFPSEPDTIGQGTQCALAAALAAPEADLTLIRIDPAAPHQLEAVVRLVKGEPFHSDSIAQRTVDLQADETRLRLRRQELLEERRNLLSAFGSYQGPIKDFGDVKDPRERQQVEETKRRDEHYRKVAELERDQKALQARQERFVKLLEAEQALNGIQVVSSSLVWNSGYPVDGSNPLSHLLEAEPCRKTFWFQAAGNTRGQNWAGLFRDTDGNRVMEFAPPETPLPRGRWTRELNFLAWEPLRKERTRDLPAGVKLRVSIQWREAHDPDLYGADDPAYRRSLADLRLVVLRQRDPSGAKLAVDDFQVIGRSLGLPQRLDNQPAAATYEQLVDFAVDPAGRYAVRVEGRLPSETRPPDKPGLPVNRSFGELWPRLFVEVADGPSRLRGRAVWLDYASDLGTLGLPADARGVATVGAADTLGAPQLYSTSGPALNRGLLPKPNLLAIDALHMNRGWAVEVFGSALSAPFAAGRMAAALSAGYRLR